MTEPTVDTPAQPMCPRCGDNPTAMSVQVSEEAWQDVCERCGAKAQKKDKTLEVVTIARDDV